jgi:hypothetical protein
VALLFAGGPSPAEWAELLAPRRRHITAVLASLGEERQRHTARGYLGPLAIAAFRRGELALQAELAWYDECDELLAELHTPFTPLVPPASITTSGAAGTNRHTASHTADPPDAAGTRASEDDVAGPRESGRS